MDHVYLCRAGENEELRYSLRSLAQYVDHDRVFIIGGWPDWVTGIETIPNPHQHTTSHLRLACETDDISDPFMMWHDDMYAVQPVGEVPVMHNGPLKLRQAKSRWAHGQRATARWLESVLPGKELLSYDLHVPLLVRKWEMLYTLDRLGEIRTARPHKRTAYGNIAGLGGTYQVDCKVQNPRTTMAGAWLSSGDSTFTSSVYPRLSMLKEKCRYER